MTSIIEIRLQLIVQRAMQLDFQLETVRLSAESDREKGKTCTVY